MNKADEYRKIKEEFDQWFKKEMELLQSTPPDYHATQNQIAKLYHDLDNFVKTHSKFRKTEYKSKSQIIVEIKNKFCYGCEVHFLLDWQGMLTNQLKLVFLGDELSSFHQQFSKNCSYHLNVVYRYLALLAGLSKKFSQLSNLEKEAKQEIENEEVKQERIRQLQGRSAEEWIKSFMNNTIYPYFIEHFAAKFVVHVKINAQLHLSIPILKKSFQKSVPLILETIKQYEEFKIKGVIVKTLSSMRYVEWENDNKL